MPPRSKVFETPEATVADEPRAAVSLSLLRRPHDHHRNFHARLRAKHRPTHARLRSKKQVAVAKLGAVMIGPVAAVRDGIEECGLLLARMT